MILQLKVLPQLNGYYFGIVPILVTDTVDCGNSGDDDKKLTTQEEEAVIETYEDAETEWQALKTTYASLLDGGNIASLYSSVSSADNSTYSNVRQQLVNTSPYLSRTVLETFVNRNDLFSRNDLETILSANPDELQSASFQTFLYEELDEALADSILLHRDDYAARTQLSDQIALQKATMHRAANQILLSELADTTGLNLPKIRTWLRHKNSLESEYAIADSYLSEGDTTAARQVRDSIAIKFELTSLQSSEHDAYTDWMESQISVLRRGGDLFLLDSVAVTEVEAIAENSTGIAAVQTQGLLNTAYGYDYRIDPKLPEMGGQGLILPPGNGNMPDERLISAYPNPAKEIVTFEYSLPNQISSGGLLLLDMNGILLDSWLLDGHHGKLILSLKELPIGVYLYRMRYPGNITLPGKLVITK
jgi:hypothetical protein